MTWVDVARETFTTGSEFSGINTRDAELGGTWVRTYYGTGGQAYLVGNPPTRARFNTSEGGLLARLGSVTLATADYRVGGEIRVVSTSHGDLKYLGFVARSSGTTNLNSDGYFFGYEVSTGKWIIAAFVSTGGGTITPIGDGYAATLTTNQVVAVELGLTGTSLSLTIDGVERVAVTDGTFTAAGKVGLLGLATGSVAVSSLQWQEFYTQVDSVPTTGSHSGASTNSGAFSGEGIDAPTELPTGTFSGESDSGGAITDTLVGIEAQEGAAASTGTLRGGRVLALLIGQCDATSALSGETVGGSLTGSYGAASGSSGRLTGRLIAPAPPLPTPLAPSGRRLRLLLRRRRGW